MTARKPAKRKRTAARETAAPALEHDDDFGDEVGADIEEFFNDQDEGAIVMVYKIGKPGERDGFLDTLSVSALRNPSCQQVIRDTYGAGNFRLKMKAPDLRGVMRWSGSKTITIAEKPGGSGPAANGRPHSIEDFFREEAHKTQQLLLAMISNNKPQQMDLAGLAALLTAVNGGGGKQTDLAAVVSAFTTLKQSAEPGNGLAQVKDVLEIARSISGGPAAAGSDEPDTSWPGLIKGVLGAFSGAAGAAQPGRRMIPASVNGNGAAAARADDDDEQPSEEEMFQQFLAGQLSFLKSKAAANKPVEWWIQYTLENADEVGNHALFTALKGGATFEHLLQFDPEIASNPALRVWFQKFYDGLKGSLQPAAAIPWIVRNPADVAGNEIPGASGQPKPGDSPGGGNPGQP